VTLPHTWNNLDGQDGGNDYFRGECRYKRALPAFERGQTERVFLEIPAAGLNACILINGEPVVAHEGGFSRFRADIPAHLTGGDVLSVFVDNRERAHVYPQFADFTFCGGLYRGADLVIVPESHISLSDSSSDGVKITPRLADDLFRAQIEICALVSNAKPGQLVSVTIVDADGQAAAAATADAAQSVSLTLTLDRPRLWDGADDPHLYTARVVFLDRGEIDRLDIPFGVRSFSVDAQKGFFS